MSLEIIQVDAFTNKPFGGNPAAVCVLPEPADAGWMQNVAMEMNLSETAFLYSQEDGYNLRWFTPAAEVDLCGHATLASAHTLWEQGYLGLDAEARFYTRSGLLTAQRRGDWIELNFPATPAQAITSPPELLQALGLEQARYVGETRFDYLVEVDFEAKVRSLAPNFALLKKISRRGVVVTSRAGSAEFDFVSRFFAPAVGIDEDPVTGSAHCCLGPYWQSRLGQATFVAYQASSRGGVVKVRVAGERVYLSGQAVTVLKCELV